MEERVCPNGWKHCEMCSHERKCIAGLYHGEIETIVLAAEIAEAVVSKAAIESAMKIKGTWFEGFNRMCEEERWRDYRKYHVGDLMYKEPYKAMAGAIVPGGGSKSNVKKSNKGCKPTVYIWGATI